MFNSTFRNQTKGGVRLAFELAANNDDIAAHTQCKFLYTWKIHKLKVVPPLSLVLGGWATVCLCNCTRYGAALPPLCGRFIPQ